MIHRFDNNSYKGALVSSNQPTLKERRDHPTAKLLREAIEKRAKNYANCYYSITNAVLTSDPSVYLMSVVKQTDLETLKLLQGKESKYFQDSHSLNWHIIEFLFFSLISQFLNYCKSFS